MNNKGYFEFTLVEFMIWISICGLICAIAIPPILKAKYTAPIEAKLYNDKYGTHYTASEFFWSGDTIKSFLNGGEQSTQNINIRGAIPVEVVK